MSDSRRVRARGDRRKCCGTPLPVYVNHYWFRYIARLGEIVKSSRFEYELYEPLEVQVVPGSDRLPRNPDQYWELLQGADWQGLAKRLLKSELHRSGVSYAELTRRLSLMGIQETESNVRNKINRGTFQAAFFLQCFAAFRKWNVQFGEPGHPFVDLFD